MANNKISVGVIGAGGNTTSKHIPGLQAIDGVEVVGVCNRSRASSQRVVDEFGLQKVYDHWQEVIQDDAVDAVVIGTWPYLHARATVAALAADKHVMCEARMARDAGEAAAMLAAAQAKPHLAAQIVPSPFTLAVDKTIQRLIAEDYLGDLVSIEVQVSNGAFNDPEAPLHWRQSFEYSGYNIMSLGIRYEALMRWVGEATQVMAMGKTVTKMRFDADSGRKLAVRVPQHLNVLAEMACGAQLHMLLTEVSGLHNTNEAWLFGTEGTLCLRGGELLGGRRGDAALQKIAQPPEEVGAWRVEEEFVNAIRGVETISHTSFEDGLKYMQFIEAVSRSMAEKRAINLPL